MSPSVLLLFVFVATFAFVIVGLYYGAAWLKVGVHIPASGITSDEADDHEGPLLLREEGVSSISFWAGLLERFSFVPILSKLISDAGLNWSVGRFTSMMLLGGASMAVVLSRIAWLPSIAVLGGATMAMLAPFFYVNSKRTKRFEAFEQGFPDALDSLGRAMRAGHALSAGMEMVAFEAAQPVSGEFRKVLEEWRLGQSWDQALEHLVERVPLVCVSLFVAAVRMQNRTGGRLHEILGRVSEGVRESMALDGEIRAISAHGKLTGAILTAMPLGIAVMLNYSAPGHLDILVDHPIGKYLIGMALTFLVAAHFVMRKILDIKI